MYLELPNGEAMGDRTGSPCDGELGCFSEPNVVMVREDVRDRDAAQAAALRRLVAALDASAPEADLDWRKALTHPPYVNEEDELAAAWAEVARVCLAAATGKARPRHIRPCAACGCDHDRGQPCEVCGCNHCAESIAALSGEVSRDA